MEKLIFRVGVGRDSGKAPTGLKKKNISENNTVRDIQYDKCTPNKTKKTQSTEKSVTFKEDIFKQFLQSNACSKNCKNKN